MEIRQEEEVCELAQFGRFRCPSFGSRKNAEAIASDEGHSPDVKARAGLPFGERSARG